MHPSPARVNESTGDLQVLVFGPQAHSVGTDRLHIADVHVPITASSLLSKISDAYPDLAASIGLSRIAINHQFAAPEQLISLDDEIALVGLISGG
ncbi:MoaD/ThiS family protein [Allorhodopirellula heiligendammensis]|uniref:ThiS family protein n=1 Tax=Allorhodopirellula heiligendammensis TaxID=2714739 RepID=A0A5C6BIS9_9BACT|nr:MoaD/ThiS family protein [Allorhodopirellula heiligendammensis]TWU11109.1 hypothetical protein Poly21_50160 [Allorhodopirellula heiligendammensis]